MELPSTYVKIDVKKIRYLGLMTTPFRFGQNRSCGHGVCRFGRFPNENKTGKAHVFSYIIDFSMTSLTSSDKETRAPIRASWR